MNSQKYAILFCALLASTFVHETLARQALVADARRIDQQSSRPRSSISSVVKRSVSPQELSAAVINYGLDYSQFVVHNADTNTACAYEPESNTCAFWDGAEGTAIFINLATNVYVRVEVDTVGSWDASTQSIEDLLVGIGSIISVINAGTTIAIGAAITADKVILGNIIKTLSIEIGAEISADISLVFNLVVAFSVKLIGLLRGTLNGVLKFVSKTLVAVAGDLGAILNVLIGFAQICAAYTGGLAALIALNIELDLSLVLNAVSGLAGLAIILTALGAKINLNLIASVLNDVGVFLNLVLLIGGGSILGVSGVFNVLAQLVAALDGEIELSVAIQTLIRYCAYAKIYAIVGITVSASIALVVGALSTNNDDYDNAGSLSVLNNLLSQLTAGTCIYKTVNLSLAIQILIAGAVTDVLGLVIRVVALVFTVFGDVLCISTILLSLYLCLDNTLDAIALDAALGLGLDVDLIWGSTNILAALVGSVTQILLTLTTIATILLTSVVNLKLSILLPRINVLDTIYGLFKTTVSVNTSKILANCVDANNPANIRIRAIVNVILGL